MVTAISNVKIFSGRILPRAAQRCNCWHDESSYSQGTKSDPSQYELSFVEHLLDSLTEGARAAVIVPQSSMTGKTKDEQTFKENILKHHTLEGVIPAIQIPSMA